MSRLEFGPALKSFVVFLSLIGSGVTAWAEECPDALRTTAVVDALTRLTGDPDSAVRRRAIDHVYAEGLRALASDGVSRGLKKALSAVTPNLFAQLFEPTEPELRRRAAFAIAGLRRPGLIDDLDDEDPERQRMVRHEVESYLAERKSYLFTFLDIEHVAVVGSHWRTRMSIAVTDELPVLLDGQAPRAARPRWLEAYPDLRVTIHEGAGRIYRELRFRGRNARKLELRGTFELELPRESDLRLFVDLRIDGRYLESYELSGAHFAAYPGGRRD